MKKRAVIQRLAACMVLMYVMTGVLGAAFAAGPVSLEDLANSPTPVATQAPAATQAPTATPAATPNMANPTDFVDAMKDATKMDVSGAEVQAITSPLVRVVGMVVQVIGIVVTVGLSLRVAIDLLYIAVPFCRVALANGHQGNPQAGNQAMGQPGMGSTFGGGYGGYGRSTFGGGYGGGFGSPMGGMGMGAMGAMGSNANADQGSMMGRIQWVSGAALNAVAAENTVGPDGKVKKPFVEYAKDMAVTLVAVPILLVLLWSGALQNLGFMLGQAMAGALGGISI